MHPIQEKIYQIYTENNNSLPSYRQLIKMVGVSSLNTVAYHVAQLKKAGYFDLANESNAIIKLTLKNLINLDNKPGVFVILENKTPLSVHSSENIKSSIMEQISNNNSPLIEKIKNNPEKINIAYHIIDTSEEREDLKNHLINFYKLEQ